MKKTQRLLLAIISISLTFISCKNEYERNMNKMTTLSKEYISEKAFKSNGKVEFIISNPISYDTISENDFDTLKLLKLNNIRENLYLERKGIEEKMNENLRELSGLKYLGWKHLYDLKLADGKKLLKQFDIKLDSLKKLNIEDSLITARIKKRTKIEYSYNSTYP